MNRTEILKHAKKRKRVTIRDFWYYDLEQLVHEGLLHKTLPKRGRGVGWPVYIISKRGLKSLENSQKTAGKARANS